MGLAEGIERCAEYDLDEDDGQEEHSLAVLHVVGEVFWRLNIKLHFIRCLGKLFDDECFLKMCCSITSDEKDVLRRHIGSEPRRSCQLKDAGC